MDISRNYGESASHLYFRESGRKDVFLESLMVTYSFKTGVNTSQSPYSTLLYPPLLFYFQFDNSLAYIIISLKTRVRVQPNVEISVHVKSIARVAYRDRAVLYRRPGN